MTRFRIGQEVVCIDAYCDELTLNAIYTISATHQCCTQWLSFHELPIDTGDEACAMCSTSAPRHIKHDLFISTAFRPLMHKSASADLAAREAERALDGHAMTHELST